MLSPVRISFLPPLSPQTHTDAQEREKFSGKYKQDARKKLFSLAM